MSDQVTKKAFDIMFYFVGRAESVSSALTLKLL